MSDSSIMEAVKAFLKPIISEAIQEASTVAEPEVAAAAVVPPPTTIVPETQATAEDAQPDMSKYYTIEEAAEVLHICVTSVYNLFKRNKLTKLKVLGKSVVAKAELENAVESQEVFRYRHGK